MTKRTIVTLTAQNKEGALDYLKMALELVTDNDNADFSKAWKMGEIIEEEEA